MSWMRLLISGLLCCAVLPAFAQPLTIISPAPAPQPYNRNRGQPAGLSEIFNAEDRASALKRTNLTYAIARKTTPFVGIESIQPIYENFCNTFFGQFRLGYSGGSGMFNVGFGYRYIRQDRQIMLGLNVFYDQTMQYLNKRVGIGGEVFSTYATFRVNYYDDISIARSLNTFNGVTSYQRALSGFDGSIEVPFPFLSWIHFVAQGSHWYGNNYTGINGGTASLRIFPARQLELDGGLKYDNVYKGQAFLRLDYYLGAADFIENSASTPHYESSLFAPQKMQRQRLQKVIRYNDIMVEETEPNGLYKLLPRGS